MAQILFAYALLGRAPEGEAAAALDANASEMARRSELTGSDAICMVWAYACLRALQGTAFPACHAELWDTIVDMRPGDLHHAGLKMVFHSYLMHQNFLPSADAAALKYPDWLKEEARDAWLYQTLHDVHSSKPHLKLAKIIQELGFNREVERFTEDGYFSMDIYLPDYDAAVEFDGPWHYYRNYMDDHLDGPIEPSSDDYDRSSEDGEELFRRSDTTATAQHCTPYIPAEEMRKTAKTQLRDLFLAKRCAKVVTVPFYDFYRENERSLESLSAYVAHMLAGLKKQGAGTRSGSEAGAKKNGVVAAGAEAATGAAPAAVAEASSSSSSSSPESPERALKAEIERWKSLLPKRALEKLTSDISAAPTSAAEKLVVYHSATADQTKVRASARRALLEAFAEFAASSSSQKR